MADTLYTIVSLRELKTKLIVEISELRKKYAELEAKNIKVEAENTKLKQDKEETQLEAGSHQCSTSPICIENKSSEDKVIDEFLDLKEKERVSNIIREKNREKKLGSQDPLSYNKDISQSSKNKIQKFIAEVSKNSSSSISNSNADNDVMSTTLNETESQPSNNSFTFLYKKLCNTIILADHKIQEAILCYCNFGKALIQRRNELVSEKQVDPESNAVSRILNKEVRAQLPANIPDALLWKRIEKAKKLYKPFSAIGSDQQISCEKENKDSEFSETKVTTTITSSILLSHTSNSGDELNNDRDSDSSEVKIQVSVPDDKDSMITMMKIFPMTTTKMMIRMMGVWLF
ncbi:hypothetical protein F8M41_022082 [Gigaspora margarita]|uniref:Uncharacterized protein n=1 Tax=Gigaspora margarita TaxID=4874 RepID=A0A8H4EIA5_GIGMA|nr:hypothetical protein F8M41_022082 [Gigaspora margarita]